MMSNWAGLCLVKSFWVQLSRVENCSVVLSSVTLNWLRPNWNDMCPGELSWVELNRVDTSYFELSRLNLNWVKFWGIKPSWAPNGRVKSNWIEFYRRDDLSWVDSINVELIRILWSWLHSTWLLPKYSDSNQINLSFVHLCRVETSGIE